jgi:hypothetical protein
VELDDSCHLVVRWLLKGRLSQKIAVYQSLDHALKKKDGVLCQLKGAGAEYYLEYLPRFGEPIIYSSPGWGQPPLR